MYIAKYPALILVLLLALSLGISYMVNMSVIVFENGVKHLRHCYSKKQN